MINKNKISVICASLALFCVMSVSASGCNKTDIEDGTLTDAQSTKAPDTTVYEIAESEKITEAYSEETTEKVTEVKTEAKTEGAIEGDTEVEETTLVESESETITEGFSDTDSTDTEKVEDESVTEEISQSEETSKTEEPKNNNIVKTVLGAVLGVLLAGGVILYLSKKKKNK